MITLKACPACNSHSITEFNQAGLAPHIEHEIMPGVKVDAVIITHYFVCQNCSLIFQNPRLSDAELQIYYSQGYYRQQLNMTDQQMDTDEEKRARYDAAIIKQHLGGVRSHLDIGCSRGYLLDEVGAEIKVGVEENTGYVRIKGVEVYPEISLVPQKTFDLVTAIHVLEHLPLPLESLKSFVAFINKEGVLVIEVPTWKSPGGPLRLAHLHHFEPDVLRLLCKQLGLQVLRTEFTPHLMLICKLSNN